MQMLKPLEEATRELSVEQTVSSSKVIPLLNAILHELQKNVVDDDETQVLETQDSRNLRFKEVPFIASALDRAKKLLLTLMKRFKVNVDDAHSSTDNPTYVISDSESTQADSAEKKSLWNSFEEELKKKKVVISWLLGITKKSMNWLCI